MSLIDTFTNISEQLHEMLPLNRRGRTFPAPDNYGTRTRISTNMYGSNENLAVLGRPGEDYHIRTCMEGENDGIACRKVATI